MQQTDERAEQARLEREHRELYANASPELRARIDRCRAGGGFTPEEIADYKRLAASPEVRQRIERKRAECRAANPPREYYGAEAVARLDSLLASAHNAAERRHLKKLRAWCASTARPTLAATARAPRRRRPAVRKVTRGGDSGDPDPEPSGERDLTDALLDRLRTDRVYRAEVRRLLASRPLMAEDSSVGYLTIAGAAAFADVSTSTIAKWIKAGRLAATGQHKATRIARADLVALIERSGRSNGADLSPLDLADREDAPRWRQ